MSLKYRIVKGPETIDYTGCRWLKYSFNSKVAPCRLCAGARLDSNRDYHTGRVKQ